jgi:hypothetical protein
LFSGADLNLTKYLNDNLSEGHASAVPERTMADFRHFSATSSLAENAERPQERLRRRSSRGIDECQGRARLLPLSDDL